MRQALDGSLKCFSPAKREASLLSPQAQPLSRLPSPLTGSKNKKETLIDIQSLPDEVDRLIRVHSIVLTHTVEGVNAGVKVLVPSIPGNKLSLNHCVATGRLCYIPRANLLQMEFPFCYCEPLPHYSIFCLHLVKRTSYTHQFGAFCIIPNICLALMLYQHPLFLVPHFPSQTYFLSGCHSSSFSRFSLLSTHSLLLFSVPIFLCVCVCVSFSLPSSLSPSYSCALHRFEAE